MATAFAAGPKRDKTYQGPLQGTKAGTVRIPDVSTKRDKTYQGTPVTGKKKTLPANSAIEAKLNAPPVVPGQSAPVPAATGTVPNSVVAQFPQAQPGSPAALAGTYDTSGRTTFTGGGSQYGNQYNDPVGGFASRYPTGQLGNVMANPGILAQDVLTQVLGQAPNQQLLGSYAPVAAYAPLIAELMSSFTGNPSLEAGINTGADYLQQMATPGGRGLDSKAILAAILNPAAGSDLYDLLNQIDPQTGLPINAGRQADLMLPYIGAATSGDTALHQNAQRAALNRAVQQFDYQSAQPGGGDIAGATFYDYLRRQGILG